MHSNARDASGSQHFTVLENPPWLRAQAVGLCMSVQLVRSLPFAKTAVYDTKSRQSYFWLHFVSMGPGKFVAQCIGIALVPSQSQGATPGLVMNA
jgi:hypothetical protein